MENNQNSEKLTSCILTLIGDILMAICHIIMRSLLWVARNIWKRYFGIETPVYKLWWKEHVKSMQKRLDKVHNVN